MDTRKTLLLTLTWMALSIAPAMGQTWTAVSPAGAYAPPAVNYAAPTPGSVTTTTTVTTYTPYSPSAGYAEPGYTQPAYTQPAQPAYAEPLYPQPAYTQPAQPAYSEPTYTQVNYTQPACMTVAYARPAYAQPVYVQPTYAARPLVTAYPTVVARPVVQTCVPTHMTYHPQVVATYAAPAYPAPAYAVAAPVTPAAAGPRVWVHPKVYVEGHPIRNLLTAITP